jgi:hypothetical protein
MATVTSDEQIYARAILEHDEDFLASETFREQCARACIALRINHVPPAPFRLIASLFDIDHGALRTHWKNFCNRGNEIGENGRPSVLPPDVLDQVVDMISEGYREKRPLTLVNIKAILLQKWNIKLVRDTLYHILHRDPIWML